MENIILILTVGALCIGCFFVGAKVGQTVARGEKIEAPNLNPIKAVQEHRAKKEANSEQDRIDAIMRNIERYNGTSYGQEEVPRG